LALSPVSAAVYGVLAGDATLSALVGGRIYDDVRQAPAYPYLWYAVRERERRGFGGGTFPEVDVRLHAFSIYRGAKEAQDILNRCVTLLKDATLTVPGFQQAGHVVYDETVLLPDEDVNGVKVRELVALFRVWVEA
jgi:hypothetical protein